MKYSVTFRPTAGMDYVTDETGKDLSPHEIVATIVALEAENARLRELLAYMRKNINANKTIRSAFSVGLLARIDDTLDSKTPAETEREADQAWLKRKEHE